MIAKLRLSPSAAVGAPTEHRTRHETHEAWREGDHDDLVLAVAMACWCGERYMKKLDSLPRPGTIADEGVPVNVVGYRS
jgi:hypothetical protein